MSDRAKVYRVSVAEEDRIWLVTATELKGVHSYGRSLREAAANIREAIAAAEDLDEWEDLPLRFVLQDPETDLVLRALAGAVTEAEAAATRRQQAVSEAIDRLRTVNGFSYRDIAVVVGLSHQRVAQLAARPEGS